MCQNLKGATKGILKNKVIASNALLWNQERSERNGKFTATHTALLTLQAKRSGCSRQVCEHAQPHLGNKQMHQNTTLKMASKFSTVV